MTLDAILGFVAGVYVYSWTIGSVMVYRMFRRDVQAPRGERK